MTPSRSLYLSWVLLIILAIVNLYPVVKEFLGTRPYWGVERVSVDWREDKVEVKYKFIKNGACEIKAFAIVGSGLIPRYLDYENRNVKTPSEELFDREEGSQGLHIVIDTKGQYYDNLEIRTRHLCPEGLVDKVFTTIENPANDTNPHS